MVITKLELNEIDKFTYILAPIGEVETTVPSGTAKRLKEDRGIDKFYPFVFVLEIKK